MAESKRADAAARDDASRTWRRHITSGLIFGLVGALTGTTGLFFSYRAEHEQAAIRFAAYPSASAGDLTSAGLGIRMQLVNQSLRPVIVRGASLWVGTTQLASATGYLKDPRGLARAADDPGAVTAAQSDFPLNLNAREGRTAALVFDFWNVPGTAASGLRRLNLVLAGLGPAAEAATNERFDLELSLAPGGVRRFALQVLPQTSAADEQTASEAWLVSPLGQGQRLVGLLLRRASAGRAVDFVRLDVWKQGSTTHSAIVRPVTGAQAALFPLQGLTDGAYTATFELDGNVIAVRGFSIPWRREHCATGFQEAPAGGPGAATWC